MSINMGKLEKASYEEIRDYCLELAWRGLVNQGRQGQYPATLDNAVLAIIQLVAQWREAKLKAEDRG